LLELIGRCEKNSLIVAGEVCLSGYDYENFEQMVAFSNRALKELLAASKQKTIILTMLSYGAKEVKNFAYVLHDGKIIRKQPKVKLFQFGEEHKYMSPGKSEDIAIFTVNGVKIGILICFELRFKTLWQQLEGADIIAVPSWWGRLRLEHYTTLTRALAVMNQCYVVCSDNLNEECNAQSGIVTPFGIEQRNINQKILTAEFDPQEIKKMRRYMDVGIEQVKEQCEECIRIQKSAKDG